MAFPIDFSHSPWESKHSHQRYFPSDAKSFCKLKYLKSQGPLKLQQALEDCCPFPPPPFRNTMRHLPMAVDTSSLSCFQLHIRVHSRSGVMEGQDFHILLCQLNSLAPRHAHNLLSSLTCCSHNGFIPRV